VQAMHVIADLAAGDSSLFEVIECAHADGTNRQKRWARVDATGKVLALYRYPMHPMTVTEADVDAAAVLRFMNGFDTDKTAAIRALGNLLQKAKK
jgi:hypothetical protein